MLGKFRYFETSRTFGDSLTSLLVLMEWHRSTDVPNLQHPSGTPHHVWHMAKGMGNYTKSNWFYIMAASEQQGILAAVFYSGDDIDLTLEKNVISPKFEGLFLY